MVLNQRRSVVAGAALVALLGLLIYVLNHRPSADVSNGTSAIDFRTSSLILDFPKGGSAYGLAKADFNNDGKLDLAVTEHGVTNEWWDDQTYISISLGNGDGTFAKPLTMPMPKQDNGNKTGPAGILAKDFDGDGKADLLVAAYERKEVLFYKGNGDGTFADPKVIKTSIHPWQLQMADLNGDGKDDIVVNGDNSLSVLFGNGDGTFQPEVIVHKDDYWIDDVALVDMDGKNGPDIVFGNYDPARIGVMLNDGQGHFSDPQWTKSPQNVRALVVADFNEDKKPDILVPSFFGNPLFLGKGDGTFDVVDSGIQPEGSPNQGALTQHEVIDLNDDGHADAVFIHTFDYRGAPNYVTVAYGDGTGHFDTHEWVGSPGSLVQYGLGKTIDGQNPQTAIMGDFNGDGRPDIVVASEDTNNKHGDVAILLSEAKTKNLFHGIESLHLNSPNADIDALGRRGLALFDLTSDHKQDLLALGDHSVLMKPGHGDGTFGPEQVLFNPNHFLADQFGNLHVVDFDKDGIPDLVMTGRAGRDDLKARALVAFGDKNGTYGESQTTPSGWPTYLSGGQTIDKASLSWLSYQDRAAIPDFVACSSVTTNWQCQWGVDKSGNEWATEYQREGAWIDLRWKTERTITAITLRDRQNDNDQVTKGHIVFSDGSTLPVDTLPNNGQTTPLTITLPESKKITSLRFIVDAVSDRTSNSGLREISVTQTDQSEVNTAPAAKATCSTNTDNCYKVNDQRWDQEWSTSRYGEANQTVGAWVKLTWDTPQTIGRVNLGGGESFDKWVTGGTLTLSDGSGTPDGTTTIKVGELRKTRITRNVVLPKQFQVKELTFTVDSVSPASDRVNIAEIETYANQANPDLGRNLALEANVTCSSVIDYGYYHDPARRHDCTRAADIWQKNMSWASDGGYDPEWESNNETTGVTYGLSWDAPIKIGRVVLRNRFENNQRIASGTLLITTTELENPPTSPSPTSNDSSSPTPGGTSSSSASPTDTQSPTDSPSSSPSINPSTTPSASPTVSPSSSPSVSPTPTPTQTPVYKVLKVPFGELPTDQKPLTISLPNQVEATSVKLQVDSVVPGTTAVGLVQFQVFEDQVAPASDQPINNLVDVGPVDDPDASFTNMVTGDFNGDGYQDFAVCDIQNDGQAKILPYFYNPNQPHTFTKGKEINLGPHTTRFPNCPMDVGDLNGDGKLDLIVYTGATTNNDDEERRFLVFLGNGEGTFRDPIVVGRNWPLDAHFSDLKLADLNNDGKLDLVASGHNLVMTALGNGDGTFATPNIYQPNTDYHGHNTPLSVADFDRDGNLDVAIVQEGTSLLGIYPGNGDGTLGTFKPYAYGASGRAIAVGDLDGDNKTDIVAAHAGDHQNFVSVVLNRSYEGDPNLEVTKIDSPKTVEPGQTLSVTTTITNIGGQDAVGEWDDGLYLTSSDHFDIKTAQLLTKVHHINGLGSHKATYQTNFSVTMPPVGLGTYHLFVKTDINNRVVESKKDNNVLVAPESLTVSAPTLGVGQTVSGSINRDDNRYYQVNLPQGQDLRFQLSVGTDVADLLIRQGQLPTVADFDKASQPADDGQTVTLPQTQSGVVYLLIHGKSAANGQNYRLSLKQLTFETSGLYPSKGSNHGSVTLTIQGANFSDATAVTLVRKAAKPNPNDPFPIDQVRKLQTAAQDYQDKKTSFDQFLATRSAVETAQSAAYADYAKQVKTCTGTEPHFIPSANLGAGGAQRARWNVQVNDYVTERSANQVLHKDSTLLYVTFDLTNLCLGDYDVKIADSGKVSVNPKAFTVTNGPVGTVKLSLNAPTSIRAGWDGDATIQYTNTGETDVQAPLLALTAVHPPVEESISKPAAVGRAAWLPPADLAYAADSDSKVIAQIVDHAAPADPPGQSFVNTNIQFKLPEWSQFYSSAVEFLGTNSDETHGPAGILAPGATGTITIPFRNLGGTADIDLALANQGPLLGDYDISTFTNNLIKQLQVDDQTAKDLEGRLAGPNRPSWLDGHYSTYFKALAADATETGLVGDTTTSVGHLLNYELLKQNIPQLINANRLAQQIAGKLSVADYRLTVGTNQLSIGLLGSQTVYTKADDGLYHALGNPLLTVRQTGSEYQLHVGPDQTKVFDSNHDGHLTRLEDSSGRVIERFGWNGQVLQKTTDEFGHETTYQYDGANHLTALIDSYGRTTKFESGTTTYPDGRSGKVVTTNGLITEIDNLDQTHHYVSYDQKGRVVEEHDDQGLNKKTYTYSDQLGVTMTDATGAQTTVLINSLGKPAKIINPLHQITEFSYDAQGRLLNATGAGIQLVRHYDSFGRIDKVTTPNGEEVSAIFDSGTGLLKGLDDPLGQLTQFDYDQSHQLTNLTDPLGQTRKFVYTDNHQTTQTTNRRGQTITNHTNDYGQLVDQTTSDGLHNQYTYDGHGNLASSDGGSGKTIFTYDSNDHLTKVTYPDQTSLSYTYDQLGREASITDQTGWTVHYTYNQLGQVDQLTDKDNQLIIRYSYDQLGRLTTETRGNGATTSSSYDSLSRLTSKVERDSQNREFNHREYVYNDAGLLEKTTDKDGETYYTYDKDHQLTSVRQPSGQIITYQYDANGNRTQVDDNGQVTTYGANAVNEYTQVGGSALAYDADGNLISQTINGQSTTYTYNALNRLTEMASPTDHWQYRYDAFGNLIEQTHNGQTTKFENDPLAQLVIASTDTNQAMSHYVTGIGLVSQTDNQGATTYLHSDLVGTTTDLTDAHGLSTAHAQYLPFGEQQTGDHSTFGFVGRSGVVDNGSGLLFMQNRWYDPRLGRFVSQDPTDLRGGDTNLYRYVWNQPQQLVDPSGLGGSGPAGFPGSPANWNSTNIGPGSLKAPANPPPMNGPFGNPNVPNNGPAEFVGRGQPGNIGSGTNGWARTGPNPLYNAENAAATSTAETTGTAETAAEATEGASGGGLGLSIAGVTLTAVAVTGILMLGDIAINGQDNSYTLSYIRDQNGGNDDGHNNFVDPNRADQINHAIEQCMARTGASYGACVDIVTGRIHNSISSDPNDMVGPTGFGDQHWVTPDESLPYTIEYENDPKIANASVQNLIITQKLDDNLDLSTFNWTSYSFGDHQFSVPSGRQSYQTRLDLRSSLSLYLDVKADLNVANRTIIFSITSIDPATGKTLPEVKNADGGFLPPDTDHHSGQGFVNYTVKAKADVVNKTQVKAKATIKFDTNHNLDTPEYAVTEDTSLPAATMTTLPATTTTTSIPLAWSATDDGAGVVSYDVYASDNGQSLTLWKGNLTGTSLTYDGEAGHQYGFAVVATDGVGHQSSLPSDPQTVTTIALAAPAPTPTTTTTPTSSVTPSQSLTPTISVPTTPAKASQTSVVIDPVVVPKVSPAPTATQPPSTVLVVPNVTGSTTITSSADAPAGPASEPVVLEVKGIVTADTTQVLVDNQPVAKSAVTITPHPETKTTTIAVDLPPTIADGSHTVTLQNNDWQADLTFPVKVAGAHSSVSPERVLGLLLGLAALAGLVWFMARRTFHHAL